MAETLLKAVEFASPTAASGGKGVNERGFTNAKGRRLFSRGVCEPREHRLSAETRLKCGGCCVEAFIRLCRAR